MKKLSLGLGIILLLVFFFFTFLNRNQILVINYRPFIYDLVTNAGVVLSVAVLYGVLTGFLFTYFHVLSLKEKIKKLGRNTEKADIIAEESTDKVKMLQAKVNTLEAALKEALAKK